jgi:hypothetical protein
MIEDCESFKKPLRIIVVWLASCVEVMIFGLLVTVGALKTGTFGTLGIANGSTLMVSSSVSSLSIEELITFSCTLDLLVENIMMNQKQGLSYS